MGCSVVKGVFLSSYRPAASVVIVVIGLRPSSYRIRSDDSSTRANKRSKVTSSSKAAITPSSTEGAALTPITPNAVITPKEKTPSSLTAAITIKVIINMTSKSFFDVVAWKRAHEFVLAFYKTKPMFPEDEKFALIPQFQRAAVSIAANIAEGYKKLSLADKLRFFNIAQGSLEECRYYIILCHDLGYYSDDTTATMWKLIEELSVVLNSYCKGVKEKNGISDD